MNAPIKGIRFVKHALGLASKEELMAALETKKREEGMAMRALTCPGSLYMVQEGRTTTT